MEGIPHWIAGQADRSQLPASHPTPPTERPAGASHEKHPRKFLRGKVRGKVEAHTHDRTTPIGTYPRRSGIDMERLTYTVSEVAELLGISRSKAYDLVAAGLLPIVPLPGRRTLVARAVLERLVDAPECLTEPT